MYGLRGVAMILAASVGVYGGVNLDAVLNTSRTVIVEVAMLLTLLNALAAFLETLEITV